MARANKCTIYESPLSCLLSTISLGITRPGDTHKKYIPTPLLSMCRLCPKLEGWEEQTNAPFTKKYRERRSKVNRDRYNIDEPGCKKKADMDLDLRTWNDKERFSESILNSS
jgi:hypothetical protein